MNDERAPEFRFPRMGDPHDAMSRRLRQATYLLVALSLVISLLVATRAMAEPASGADAQLVRQYAGWAGGASNAAALVNGMRRGSSVALVTTANGGTVSVAGFTPPARLSPRETAAALAAARRTLDRLGITRPGAEQIQAALVGGEVTLPGGATRMIRGSMPAPAEASATPVAAR